MFNDVNLSHSIVFDPVKNYWRLPTPFPSIETANVHAQYTNGFAFKNIDAISGPTLAELAGGDIGLDEEDILTPDLTPDNSPSSFSSISVSSEEPFYADSPAYDAPLVMDGGFFFDGDEESFNLTHGPLSKLDLDALDFGDDPVIQKSCQRGGLSPVMEDKLVPLRNDVCRYDNVGTMPMARQTHSEDSKLRPCAEQPEKNDSSDGSTVLPENEVSAQHLERNPRSTTTAKKSRKHGTAAPVPVKRRPTRSGFKTSTHRPTDNSPDVEPVPDCVTSISAILKPSFARAISENRTTDSSTLGMPTCKRESITSNSPDLATTTSLVCLKNGISDFADTNNNRTTESSTPTSPIVTYTILTSGLIPSIQTSRKHSRNAPSPDTIEATNNNAAFACRRSSRTKEAVNYEGLDDEADESDDLPACSRSQSRPRKQRKISDPSVRPPLSVAKKLFVICPSRLSANDPFRCNKCFYKFVRASDRDRHTKNHCKQEQNKFAVQCGDCRTILSRVDSLMRHIRNKSCGKRKCPDAYWRDKARGGKGESDVHLV